LLDECSTIQLATPLALLSRFAAGVQFTKANHAPLQNYPLLFLALAIPADTANQFCERL
jgi:hypothetical protein